MHLTKLESSIALVQHRKIRQLRMIMMQSDEVYQTHLAGCIGRSSIDVKILIHWMMDSSLGSMARRSIQGIEVLVC